MIESTTTTSAGDSAGPTAAAVAGVAGPTAAHPTAGGPTAAGPGSPGRGRAPAGISAAAAGTAAWVASWLPEDAPLLAARERAREAGVPVADEATGAALRVLAAVSNARHAVELGTGAGVSTLWLLRGLHADGVLTSIDSEPEHQRLARRTLSDAGTPSGRVRLIAGRALDVLPRLSDGAYDLVLCDASSAEAVDHLPGVLRILRTGGVVAFTAAMAGGRVADPSARDPDTVAARELARLVRDEPRLVPAMLPVGAGLLVAVKIDAPPVRPPV